jgi:hypothetical protein
VELRYLDQNYSSGIVKGKVAFRELEPTLRSAVARGAVAVRESDMHRLESAAPPDLPLLALLRELSADLALPSERGGIERHCEWRLESVIERDFPQRPTRTSDRLDISCARGGSAPLPARHVRRLHGRRHPPDEPRPALPLRPILGPPRERRTASQRRLETIS